MGADTGDRTEVEGVERDEGVEEPEAAGRVRQLELIVERRSKKMAEKILKRACTLSSQGDIQS
jgi:hypothetical protein